MVEDIHDYDKKLRRALEKIQEAKIPKENKEALIAFHRACIVDGIKAGRLHRYLDDLRHITRNNKKKFIDYTKTDIEELVVDLENSKYTEWTKYSYKIGIRKFFTWLKGKDGEYPIEVKWMKMHQNKCNHKLPEELLTEEEVKKLISTAKNYRDRALIATLYESGCRIAEVLNLRMKHIAFDNYGAVITVFGKTGSRRVRIVFSAGFIQEWLNMHPLHDNIEAFVWCTDHNSKEQLGYSRVCIILKRLAMRAGIQKKVNPHNFRHTRASFLANHLTESQLKEVFGWTQASKMAAVYVHLSGKNTDKAILKVYGKVIEEDTKEKEFLLPRQCIRCKTSNEITNKFCKLCGLPLDEETQIALISKEYKQNEANSLMNNLLKDPEVLALLAQKIKEVKA